MEDDEFDLRLLRHVCVALNIDPDGDRAPDLEAIAAEDGTPGDKIARLREELDRTLDDIKRPDR